MLTTIRAITLSILGAIALFLTPPSADAAAILDVTVAPITATPGQTGVTVFGTLANQSADVVFLNGDSISLASNVALPASINDTPFLTGAPLSLDIGASSGLIALFTFDVARAVPFGQYNAGSFTVAGGSGIANQANFDVLGSQNVAVNVVAAGEPPEITFSAIGFAFIGLSAAMRKRLRART